jgi:hypothetical protein
VLAELRIAQGRVDEADRLLAGVSDQPATAIAQMRLQLATGGHSTAAVLARRRLRQVDEHEMERFVLLDVLAEATGGDDLPIIDASSLRGVAGAYWARATGRAALGGGRPGALEGLEDALAGFAAADLT